MWERSISGNQVFEQWNSYRCSCKKKPTNIVLLNKAAVLTMCEGDSVIYVTFISLIVQFNAPST